MSLRSMVAFRAPDVLRSLKASGFYPTIGAPRLIGQPPPHAGYTEHVVGVYQPAPLAAPSLRPEGQLGDHVARLIDDAGVRFGDAFTYGVFDVPSVRVWPKFGVHSAPSGNFIEVYCGPDALNNPKYELPRLALPAMPITERHDAGIFLAPSWYHNYGHWMLDILPRLDLVGAALAEGLPIVVPARVEDWQRESLRQGLVAVGAEDARVLELPDGIHHFERMVLPTRVGVVPDPSGLQREFLRRMLLPIAPGHDGPKRLFVSRRDTWSRRFANEDEIEAILAARGFETVVLSKLTPAEKAGLFGAAEAIVGHVGAGLINNVFCEPGTVLIEIFQDEYFSHGDVRLAQLGGLVYGYGVGRAEGLDTWLDPAQLTDLLDRAGL